MIYYREDGIVFPNLGKTCDQVHGYLFEGFGLRRYRDLVEWGLGLMRVNLRFLADSTSSDIVCDPSVHPWPIVAFLGGRYGFVTTRVSSCGVIVDEAHEVMFQSVIRGDYDAFCVKGSLHEGCVVFLASPDHLGGV